MHLYLLAKCHSVPFGSFSCLRPNCRVGNHIIQFSRHVFQNLTQGTFGISCQGPPQRVVCMIMIFFSFFFLGGHSFHAECQDLWLGSGALTGNCVPLHCQYIFTNLPKVRLNSTLYDLRAIFFAALMS